jgi:NADH-ubiquinone oxidoreductase chain 5
MIEGIRNSVEVFRFFIAVVFYLLVIYYQNVKFYGAGVLTVLSNRIGDVAL